MAELVIPAALPRGSLVQDYLCDIGLATIRTDCVNPEISGKMSTPHPCLGQITHGVPLITHVLASHDMRKVGAIPFVSTKHHLPGRK